MMWHPQTKGRATEKTNIDLEPCAVGADISESEIPADAVRSLDFDAVWLIYAA